MNTYNRISIRRGTSGEERRQARHIPRLSPHSRVEVQIWRRAPLPVPLLSTSTPKLPKTALTQVRTQEKSEWCGVWCVFIWSPSPCIYRRDPPAICPRTDPNRHGGPISPCHLSSASWWGPWAITTWSADLGCRPTVDWARLARSSVRWLLGGAPCHIYG